MSKITGYKTLNLSDVIGTKAEKRIDEMLSSYSCPLNKDVEEFLKSKTKEFAKQRIASTYLVVAPYKDDIVLVGYFTLANKIFSIPDKVIGSKSLRRRINKFAEHNDDTKAFTLSAPLIAQLGKNYENKYNNLITGDELLKMACDQVKTVQIMLSGSLTYVECEDKQYLIDFYTENGFIRIANRTLNKSEKTTEDNKYLVQLIKHISI